MQKHEEWITHICPLHLEEDRARTERIQKKVSEQLLKQAKEEEPTMIQKPKLRRRFRPIFFAAAVIGIGAASLITANAATDGAFLTKIKLTIQGKEAAYELRPEETDDPGTRVYHILPKDGDGSDYLVREGKDSVSVEAEGDGDGSISISSGDSDGDSTGDPELEIEQHVPDAEQ